MDATEIEVTGRDTGRISLATGYASHGEAVRRTRNKAGNITEVWLAGARLKPEKAVAARDGAQIRAAQAALTDLPLHFISASTSPRNACREPSRE